MNSDLFEKPLRNDLQTSDSGVSREHWMWAERVIREVNEDIAQEENLSRHFVQGWIRWREMVGMLNLFDLGLYKKQPDQNEVTDHETFVTMMISLGNMLKNTSESIDTVALEYSGFSEDSHLSMMESLRDSYSILHSKENEKRSSLINSLIVD